LGGQSGQAVANRAGSGGGAGGVDMTIDGGSRPPGSGSGPAGGQPPSAPAVVAETSFYDMAMNAFANGRDGEGTRYLQAEFAVNRARFDQMPLSFNPQKKDTTLGVRLGVGVTYVAREGVNGKAPVIGDPAPARNRNNQPGSGSFGGPSGSSGFPGGGSTVPQDARGMLVYYGGDLAKGMLDKLEERYKKSPDFGSIWPQLSVRVLMVDLEPSTSQVSSRSDFGGAGSPFSASGSGAASYGGMSNAGPAEGLYPGLVFVGEGNFSDLLKRAKDQDLDGLLILEQRANLVPRTGQVTSETTVKFYSCEDNKEKGSTSKLNYASVAGQRVGLKDATKDPVEKELASLFTKIDRLFAVTPMPELTEEQVKGRLNGILEASKEDPLPFVNEANFYVQKGYLAEEDAQNMIIQVIGEQVALDLWSGDFDKQKAALKRWLPIRS
jgi:hypothetical protein